MLSKLKKFHLVRKSRMTLPAGGVCNGGVVVEVCSEIERENAVRVGLFSIFVCLAKFQCL